MVPLLTYSQNQIYFSETWSQNGGISAMFYKNATTTDVLNNIYVAGSTINSNNNHDIIVQKFDRFGTLLWEEIFNGAANMDDMATDIFVDDQQLPIDKWISGEAKNHNPDNLRFMYSIHVKNESLTSVKEEDLSFDVTLYPNPTKETLTVSSSAEFNNPNAKIYSLSGRLIKSIDDTSIHGKIEIDVSNLSKGIYLLRLRDNERTVTKKFIKH